MKFDIARAWKDEAYRLSLSNEQRAMLPVNPVGELTDAEMEQVYGGGGGSGGMGGGGMMPAAPSGGGIAHGHHHGHGHGHAGGGIGITGSSAASSSSCLDDTHWHSLSVALCETNVFSALQTVVPVAPLISPITVICANAN